MSLNTLFLAVDKIQTLDLSYTLYIYPASCRSMDSPPLFTFTHVQHVQVSHDKTTLLLMLESRRWVVLHRMNYMMFRLMRRDTSATFTVDKYSPEPGGFHITSYPAQLQYYVCPSKRKVVVSQTPLLHTSSMDSPFAIHMIQVQQGDRHGLSAGSQRYLQIDDGVASCCTIS